jgi:hypothetical protein
MQSCVKKMEFFSARRIPHSHSKFSQKKKTQTARYSHIRIYFHRFDHVVIFSAIKQPASNNKALKSAER